MSDLARSLTSRCNKSPGSFEQVLVRTTAGNTTYYVYGLGLIGEQNQNGYRVYHPDFRGSTVMLTDAGGSVTDRYMYDAYGNLMNHSGSSDTPFLYNGQYGIMTDGNGLVYMRARYYNPEVRRFVSQDSLEGDIGNPLSLNLFSYVENNPVNNIDPSGNILESILDLASIGYSAYELYHNPSFINFGFLVWDVGATILPGIPGSYVYKGAKVLEGVSDLKRFNKWNFRHNLGRLVGDASKQFEAHHVLPQAFRDDFAEYGLNIDDPRFGSWVNKDAHGHWSRAYNEDWRYYFRNSKPAEVSAEAIVNYARVLAEKYGFETNF